MKGNSRIAWLLNEADEVIVPAAVISELLAGFKRGNPVIGTSVLFPRCSVNS